MATSHKYPTRSCSPTKKEIVEQSSSASHHLTSILSPGPPTDDIENKGEEPIDLKQLMKELQLMKQQLQKSETRAQKAEQRAQEAIESKNLAEKREIERATQTIKEQIPPQILQKWTHDRGNHTLPSQERSLQKLPQPAESVAHLASRRTENIPQLPSEQKLGDKSGSHAPLWKYSMNNRLSRYHESFFDDVHRREYILENTTGDAAKLLQLYILDPPKDWTPKDFVDFVAVRVRGSFGPCLVMF